MADGGSLRVLAVEDDPAMLGLLRRYLEDAGYEVLTASNGAEAMKRLLTSGAPLVVTDWAMPEMDGLELCRAIRTHEGVSFAYVIMVTAVETAEDRIVEAFEAGADDYLPKPYRRRELLARLRAGERIISLQRQLENRNREVHRFNAQMSIANDKLARANDELNRMATTDELTGLTNRREVLARLTEAWAAADRYGDELACILLDVDHFKHVNDTHGHAVGDTVLKATADLLRQQTRKDEIVSRVGGEEFLILCPRSSAEAAGKAAERFRIAVEKNVVHADKIDVQITISMGVAERSEPMRSPDDLLKAADKAMYEAKRAGRNRVIVAGAHSNPATTPVASCD